MSSGLSEIIEQTRLDQYFQIISDRSGLPVDILYIMSIVYDINLYTIPYHRPLFYNVYNIE